VSACLLPVPRRRAGVKLQVVTLTASKWPLSSGSVVIQKLSPRFVPQIVARESSSPAG